MKRSVTVFTALLCSVSFIPLASASQQTAGTASMSDWHVAPVLASDKKQSPYCAMATSYPDAGLVITHARNKHGAGTVAFDFQNAELEPHQFYGIDIGFNGQTQQFAAEAKNTHMLVIDLRNDHPLYAALDAGATIDVSVQQGGPHIAAAGNSRAFFQLNYCVQALTDGPPAVIVDSAVLNAEPSFGLQQPAPSSAQTRSATDLSDFSASALPGDTMPAIEMAQIVTTPLPPLRPPVARTVTSQNSTTYSNLLWDDKATPAQHVTVKSEPLKPASKHAAVKHGGKSLQKIASSLSRADRVVAQNAGTQDGDESRAELDNMLNDARSGTSGRGKRQKLIEVSSESPDDPNGQKLIRLYSDAPADPSKPQKIIEIADDPQPSVAAPAKVAPAWAPTKTAAQQPSAKPAAAAAPGAAKLVTAPITTVAPVRQKLSSLSSNDILPDANTVQAAGMPGGSTKRQNLLFDDPSAIDVYTAPVKTANPVKSKSSLTQNTPVTVATPSVPVKPVSPSPAASTNANLARTGVTENTRTVLATDYVKELTTNAPAEPVTAMKAGPAMPAMLLPPVENEALDAPGTKPGAKSAAAPSAKTDAVFAKAATPSDAKSAGLPTAAAMPPAIVDEETVGVQPLRGPEKRAADVVSMDFPGMDDDDSAPDSPPPPAAAARPVTPLQTPVEMLGKSSSRNGTVSFRPPAAEIAGNWQTKSVGAQKDASAYCVLQARFSNQQSLFLSRSAEGNTIIGLDFGMDLLQRNQDYKTTVQVDDDFTEDFLAQAREPNLLVVQAGRKDSLFQSLNTGRALHVEMDGGAATFDISGLRGQMGAFSTCLYNQNGKPLQNGELDRPADSLSPQATNTPDLTPAPLQGLLHQARKTGEDASGTTKTDWFTSLARPAALTVSYSPMPAAPHDDGMCQQPHAAQQAATTLAVDAVGSCTQASDAQPAPLYQRLGRLLRNWSQDSAQHARQALTAQGARLANVLQRDKNTDIATAASDASRT